MGSKKVENATADGKGADFESEMVFCDNLFIKKRLAPKDKPH